ncbi:MAG: hypothetical protein RI911_797 [Candidatus Parcubacteria bacterium]|jgi:indole-3-glycerol phosphate synthase
MSNILHEIVANKKTEVAKQKEALSLESVKAKIIFDRTKRPFFELFEKGPVLIGEIKPKSPSHGALTSDPLSIAKTYAITSIDCISVLTDETYFGGNIALLQHVREITPQTIFRKEFVVDVYQIYETAMIGADAVLLIASVLDDETLKTCIAACDECGLGYIVEVHTVEETQRALNAHARVIGINNRDLDTLEVDLKITEILMQHIPKSTIAVSESGIQTAADVRKVKAAGVRGILVGASILKAGDAQAQVGLLKAALIA